MLAGCVSSVMILSPGNSLQSRNTSSKIEGEKTKNKIALWSESTPEKCLDINDSLCISHVVLLCNHRALLVNHNHRVGKCHSASQQAIQTKNESKSFSWMHDKKERVLLVVRINQVYFENKANEEQSSSMAELLVDGTDCVEDHREPTYCLQKICFRTEQKNKYTF